jgi:hypothetical protein
VNPRSGASWWKGVKAFLQSVSDADGVRDQVIAAFTAALKRSWQVGIAFVAIGFFSRACTGAG